MLWGDTDAVFEADRGTHVAGSAILVPLFWVTAQQAVCFAGIGANAEVVFATLVVLPTSGSRAVPSAPACLLLCTGVDLRDADSQQIASVAVGPPDARLPDV